MLLLTVKVFKGEQYTVEVEDYSVKVLELKQKLESRTGIAVDNQILIYKGKTLSDDKSLADCNVSTVRFKFFLAPKDAPDPTPCADSLDTDDDDEDREWSGLYFKIEYVLTEFYTPEDIKKICDYFRREIHRCAYGVDFELLEYLGSEGIRIHKAKQVERQQLYYKSYEENETNSNIEDSSGAQRTS